jgi:hypothetical protein
MEFKLNETMKKNIILFVSLLMLLFASNSMMAQQRRPIDSQHPLWFIHVDVWYQADPQKIIDLIPVEIRPYVCLNLSLSCSYDTGLNLYKKPQNAFQTYKSWGTVCQQNGMWFSCQPASGGHTHIQDTDIVTFEYFFKNFPNFLGWNYAEQFWGFDEPGDMSSSTQTGRWALFARLVEMSHKYGGLLTVSFCGNIWSHPLNPIGELKRNNDFLTACQKYPENMLFLYKYTTSSCFYNNESVTFGPFISGLTKNYGVRYDNCGWNGAMDALLGEGHGKKYPAAAGIGTVMEQTCVNGGAVWDGPELTWREECFYETSQTTVDGYKRRVWKRFDNMNGVWNDMFKKIIDGTMYIPTREEVVGKQKIVIINDVNSSSAQDETQRNQDMYATWNDLYNGIYKQTDPFNRGNGQWMDNFCYFKSTGRYGTIPMVIDLYDDAAKAIPLQIKKSQRTSKWSTQAKKQADFNEQYPEVSKGDLYVNRYRNQLVTYTPYTYLNKKKRAEAVVPLEYNTCETMVLKYDKLSSGVIREFNDSIEFYLNNHRNDTTEIRTDTIILTGCKMEPTLTYKRHTFNKNIGQNIATQKYGADSQTDTIIVKHCGGMDLSVKCSGSADRSAKTDAIAITPLPLPKQPGLYRGPIIIEAEDMDFKNISNCVTNGYDFNGGAYRSVRGHAGMGFADMGTNTSGALRHQLKLTDGQEGAYTINVRYTCTNKAGNISIKLNGSTQTASCVKTAKNEWKTVSVKANLNTGTNDLVITNTGGLPMYIDQITYQPDDVEVMKYYVTIQDSDDGTIESNISEAAEGETIRLTVKPNEGCALKELRIVNSVFYTWDKKIDITDNGEITFEMPNDNVTIMPVFVNNNKKDLLDFTNVLAGTLPEGWRTTDGDNVRNYPASNGSGPRTFTGLTGYQGKALYWRTTSAEYGRLADYPLNLEPGNYELTFVMAAWKGEPTYQAKVLSSTGSRIMSSKTYTAKPNIDGNFSGDISSAERITLTFEVKSAGKYVVQFKEVGSGMQEFLLAECRLRNLTPSAITDVKRSTQAEGLYDLHGRRVGSETRGVLILRLADGTTQKIFR